LRIHVESAFSRALCPVDRRQSGKHVEFLFPRARLQAPSSRRAGCAPLHRQDACFGLRSASRRARELCRESVLKTRSRCRAVVFAELRAAFGGARDAPPSHRVFSAGHHGRNTELGLVRYGTNCATARIWASCWSVSLSSTPGHHPVIKYCRPLLWPRIKMRVVRPCCFWSFFDSLLKSIQRKAGNVNP